MEFHFGFFIFQLCLHLLVERKEFWFLCGTRQGESSTWKAEHTTKTKPQRLKTKLCESGCANNNWTEASFYLSKLGRVSWEWKHYQIVSPVSSLLRWVKVNRQYWKEVSRTGQSRAERKATGESCSAGRVGAAFTAKRKQRAGEKPFVMLHVSQTKSQPFHPACSLTCFIPATHTWLWSWRQELEDIKI